MGLLVLALVVGAPIGGIVYWAVQQEKKRTAALQALAEGLRGEFVARPAMSAVPGLERFELFTQGRNREIRNLLSGEKDGRRIAVFDYSYVTGGGKSRATWRQTVVHLQVPGLALPGFALRPENMFHRLAGVFGYQDIDVDADPVFSKQYLLRGADEHAIRALFGPEVRAFYHNAQLCTEAAGEDVFFWRTSRVVKPDEVLPMLNQANELANRLTAGAPAPARVQA